PFTPRVITPRMEEASWGAEPSLVIRTGIPESSAARVKIAAGRACNPTADRTVTVRSAMSSPFTDHADGAFIVAGTPARGGLLGGLGDEHHRSPRISSGHRGPAGSPVR